MIPIIQSKEKYITEQSYTVVFRINCSFQVDASKSIIEVGLGENTSSNPLIFAIQRVVHDELLQVYKNHFVCRTLSKFLSEYDEEKLNVMKKKI